MPTILVCYCGVMSKLMKFCTLEQRPCCVLLGSRPLPGRHTAVHGMTGLSQRPGPLLGEPTRPGAEPPEAPRVLCPGPGPA